MTICIKHHPWNLFRIACLLAGLALLSGCATLNEDECKSADWRLIGFEDGAAGRPTAYLGKHREACAEYKITPNMDAYMRGHTEGLSQFCVPEKAYQLGISGRTYPTICPTELDGILSPAYNDGKAIYEVRSRIRQLQRLLTANRTELENIHESQALLQEEMIRHKTSKHRKLELLRDARDLGIQEARIVEENIRIGMELDSLNLELVQLQNGRR